MSIRALLGIDLGTTLLKAAAVDARSGRVLATAASALPIRAAANGQREQSAASILRSLRDVVRRLRAALGGTWSTVGAVGLAAQGGSAILMDRHTGKAHTPVQLWNDTRPLSLLAEIARRKPRSYWQRISYMAQPGAGLARIRWLQQKHPDLFRQESLYGGLGEYVYFKLTGAWRQDAGNALQIGCYDARRRVLTAEPLRLVGRDLSFVAPMRQDHETHTLSAEGARLLHLPAGLPVAGPYMDHEAGYLSAVGTSQRPLQCSLGTAWVGNYVLESGSPKPSAFQLVLPSPVGAGRLILRVKSWI